MEPRSLGTIINLNYLDLSIASSCVAMLHINRDEDLARPSSDRDPDARARL